jgi:glutamate-5-semialdehyde dehydrogenase
MSVRELVEAEARDAGLAAPQLRDDAVAAALEAAAALVRERRKPIQTANRADFDAAAPRLDEGTLDRLRLDEGRVAGLARQLEATAMLPPLDRDAGSHTLENGLRVTERRVPIGTVGANFEARPNVALDVAGQLLKSLNAVVLRTGGAALRTVTVLVDDVLRPGLERAGLPPGAVGLVRSPDREGARVLVSLQRLIPLVILRGSGETTAALARLAAEHGVRTLAHAEGGGVLYVHGSATRERALTLVDASLDRLGVCNRLNLLLVDRAAEPLLVDLLHRVRALGVDARGTARARELAADLAPYDGPVGYEWANDAERVATVTVDVVDGLEDAVRIANEETSGLAAGIVAEDEAAAARFLETYRGTTVFWHAPTRFADGFELTGAPETGINVDWVPGPRGPVTYRDLWLRQYRIVGDGTQRR